MSTEETYTGRAVNAVSEAVTAGEDLPGWLAAVLSRAAARHGGSAALTARRPGSWEAELVTRLVCGTVGWDDEDLDLYRQPHPGHPSDGQP